MTIDVPLPLELNTSSCGPGLEISKDKLTVRYVGEGRHSNDVGAIQTSRPVPSRQTIYYYEITVRDVGELGKIAIGFAEKGFKLTRQPGWEPGSFGYHGDDGCKFQHTGRGEAYGPRFGAGDTVGAGIHLGRQEMFFTLNGVKLRTAFTGIRAAALYPTIGLHSKNEQVELNFGSKPFKFDVECMVAEEREATAAAINSILVSSGVTHQLVHDYLLHYGYADTLTAFDAAAGLAGMEPPRTSGISPEVASLACRHAVRRCILAGDIDGAVGLLTTHYPELLRGAAIAGGSGGGGCDDDVQLHLSCQKFLELVRQGRIDDALHFTQTVLAALHGKSTQFEARLRDVVATIAYERPEESPLAALLSLQQREVVADVVNAALLTAARTAADTGGGHSAASSAGGSTSGGSRSKPQSALERLLQQLVAVQATRFEENGSQGDVFRLQDHLLPAHAT